MVVDKLSEEVDISTCSSSNSYVYLFRDLEHPTNNVDEVWKKIERTLYQESGEHIGQGASALFKECRLWRDTFPHLRVTGHQVKKNVSQMPFSELKLTPLQEKRQEIKQKVLTEVVKRLTTKLTKTQASKSSMKRLANGESLSGVQSRHSSDLSTTVDIMDSSYLKKVCSANQTSQFLKVSSDLFNKHSVQCVAKCNTETGNLSEITRANTSLPLEFANYPENKGYFERGKETQEIKGKDKLKPILKSPAKLNTNVSPSAAAHTGLKPILKSPSKQNINGIRSARVSIVLKPMNRSKGQVQFDKADHIHSPSTDIDTNRSTPNFHDNNILATVHFNSTKLTRHHELQRNINTLPMNASKWAKGKSDDTRMNNKFNEFMRRHKRLPQISNFENNWMSRGEASKVGSHEWEEFMTKNRHQVGLGFMNSGKFPQGGHGTALKKSLSSRDFYVNGKVESQRHLKSSGDNMSRPAKGTSHCKADIGGRNNDSVQQRNPCHTLLPRLDSIK